MRFAASPPNLGFCTRQTFLLDVVLTERKTPKDYEKRLAAWTAEMLHMSLCGACSPCECSDREEFGRVASVPLAHRGTNTCTASPVSPGAQESRRKDSLFSFSMTRGVALPPGRAREARGRSKRIGDVLRLFRPACPLVFGFERFRSQQRVA